MFLFKERESDSRPMLKDGRLISELEFRYLSRAAIRAVEALLADSTPEAGGYERNEEQGQGYGFD